MNLEEIFAVMVEKNASDAFIKADSPIHMRIYTEVVEVMEGRYNKESLAKLVSAIVSERDRENLHRHRNCELARYMGNRWRFRIVIFYEKENFSIVIRRIDLKSLKFSELNLPVNFLENMCKERRGLVLITGMAGSGKSTTIAAMIEHINTNYKKHILTIEEPIEFTFEEKKSIINQREVGKDVLSYEDALRQSVIHSPDVIYVTNIRDRNTCYAALSAAETGVLVLSTVHSVNTVSTVERIVNFFPPKEHDFVLAQLSALLKGILSLRLIPRVDAEGLIPAYETMTLSSTISGAIRENKLWEIPKCIASSDIFGMKSFKECLWELVQAKKITKESALEYSDEKKELILSMNLIKHKDELKERPS
ncbi:MAG: PilT/PilU family type 4a pilus ATPase [Candidatus Omnitrophota bacterium]|nr:PilT/PilU family type 4a pilus ATPase [Candidatus Omnitrophota bacterium]